ncbi:MAG: GAK system ATP-grasp enzyme [Candidatus Eisenbacteria bacterium]|nr:GAK system ATP-grasp enzyme [Candidatus Eisenbacteria bacterium]
MPGGWSSETLADAFCDRTGFRALIPMDQVRYDSNDRRVVCGDLDLCALDGLVIKKLGPRYGPHMMDFLELLRQVEECGVPVYSRPSRIARVLNRLGCTMVLRGAGIPMPPTVVTADILEAMAAIRQFGTAVLKPIYSTKARGMRIVDGDDGRLEDELKQFQGAGEPVMYIQQKLDLPGYDLGVCFLGGRHLGTYARVAREDSWNTTIRAGGHYERYDPSPEIIDLAYRAQSLFDLYFTSVDVVVTESGPMVFEVSAFGGFHGLVDALNLNAAERVADYVLSRS